MWTPAEISTIWKPVYGIQGQALWGTGLSPRAACEAVVTELELSGRTCINKLEPCLEGARQAGIKDNDCRDLYEEGYFLVAQARSAKLGPHAFGNMRFKRGVYVTFNYSRAGTPPRHPIGDPQETVVQVIAEHT